MLEDVVDASNFDTKEKLREIEAQMFADGCLLTQLKWEGAKTKEATIRARSEKKRTHRRNQEDLPYHRYPTRYSASLRNDKSGNNRRETGRLADRIRKVEGRIDAAKREIKKVNDKILTTLALVPQIEELAGKLESQRKAHVDTERAIRAELADIKHSFGPGFECQLQQQALEIATLKQQMQYLYAYANGLLYSAQNSSTSRTPYNSAYPTPASSPNMKPIAAF